MGLFGFPGSAATGLISVEKVSNNPDEDCRIQEDIPEDLPPHPTRLCERPARAKSPPMNVLTPGVPRLSRTFLASKSGKCENSAKNWPDYVKITPQNSTDYVKSAY